MAKSWYSMQVFTGKENVIKELIEKRVREEDLDYLIGRILIPVEKELILDGSKGRVKQKKLYFGLIFLEAVNCEETRSFLAQMVGVTNAKLTSLTNEEVANAVLYMAEVQKPEELLLSRDTQVRILEGPFKGHVGPVVEADSSKYKVGIELLGRTVPISVEIAQVERL